MGMINGPWLGSVPLSKGFMGVPSVALNYYGEWGLKNGTASGKEGPFNTSEDAFAAAVKAVRDAGAKKLPDDGYAKVVDANGNPAGPAT